MAVKANSTPRAKGRRNTARVPAIPSPAPAQSAKAVAPAEPVKAVVPAVAPKAEPVAAKPVVTSKPVETKAAEPKPTQPKPVSAEKPAEAKPVAAKAEPVAKPEPVKAPEAKAEPVITKAEPVIVKPEPVKKPVPEAPLIAKAPAPVAAAKVDAPAAVAKPSIAKSPIAKPTPATSTAKPKEPAMTTLPSFDMPEAFKTAFADFQEKAKAAYEKSTASAADYSDFAKGNIEAMVEAGKIFTAGLQELGTALVADSREAFETMTSEVKTLAAAKTPTDFVQIQSDLLKKHFDKSVAFASKQSEAALKLASETVAPISGRVSLAVEKVKASA